mgnify:CR=1 FL=1
MEVIGLVSMILGLLFLDWFLKWSHVRSVQSTLRNLRETVEKLNVPEQINFALIKINKGDQVYEGIYEFQGPNYLIRLRIPQFHYLIEKEHGRIREFPVILALTRQVATGRILDKITDLDGKFLATHPR